MPAKEIRRGRMFWVSMILLTMLCIVVSGRKKNIPNWPDKSAALEIVTIAENLAVPWEIVFLPDNSMIFTERPGRVRRFQKGKLIPAPLLQLDNIDTTKKMGLLGLTLHPTFQYNGYVYLAYNYKSNNRSFLRVARYILKKDALIQPKTLIENIPASQNHTGCRLKFGPDKKLYISTGDADEPAKAQDPGALNGKILRLNDDGSIPSDNPFINKLPARPEIWSLGHRNVQGIAFQPNTGRLYVSEHGPTGGDEVNVVVKGGNYGWPVVHHKQSKDSMISPLLEFTPSIGPAEAVFYNSNIIPQLKNHLLIACLRGEAILSIQLNQKGVVNHEFLMQKQLGRIRAIAVGPDGYLYLSTSQKDPPEGTPGPGNDKIVKVVSFRGAVAGNKVENKPVEHNPDEGRSLPENSVVRLHQELCASCHGAQLEGTSWAQPIKKGSWKHGASINDVISSISKGYPKKGMPSWEDAISEKDIKSLATYFIQLAEKNSKAIK